MNDTYLKTKKSIIVFWKIPNKDLVLRHKFLKFVEKLQYNTELRLIMVVRENEAPDLVLHDNTIP